MTLELGITTFAETYPDPATGVTINAGERLLQVVAEAEMAETVGLSVYGIGEHHRPDFAASTPAMVLAAIASRTSKIRLTPAVTVLSSDDPVRVFQQFATLDLLSSGRAELMVGRGSFIESFPLFGHSMSDYEELFSEKLDLLLNIRDNERVTWSGKFRAPLTDQAIYPRPYQDPLPVWVAVGGTHTSIIRAGKRGLPVALAIIGGAPERFAVFGQLHKRTLVESGYDPAAVPLAVHMHGFIAESTQQAADQYYPSYEVPMTKLGQERGWPAMSRGQFDMMCSPEGSLVVGDPKAVAEKIIRTRDVLGVSRFMLHISVGTLPHDQVLRSIELLGTEVAEIVNNS
jgi:probable LLM family oxidoreductase